MPKRAERLKQYCEERLGDSLRAVGYHSGDSVEIAYIRDDLVDQYPPEDVEQFIDSSRRIHTDLQGMDRQMGTAEASLHLLEDGLIVQFHYAGDDVIFLSIDRDVGRNFTEFIQDCRDAMD